VHTRHWYVRWTPSANTSARSATVALNRDREVSCRGSAQDKTARRGCATHQSQAWWYLGGAATKKCSPVSNSGHTRCSSQGGRGKTVRLSCTGISHRGTLPKVMVAENGRNHESVIGDASVQDAFRGEINEGSRVDPPLVLGGAAPPSEWPCEATQNCVATQLRFGHSGSCTLPKGFWTMSVKF